jgi:microcin C transport system substrate-binding protein
MKATQIFIIMAGLVLACAAASFAEECFPKKDWQDAPNPLAAPAAAVGGEISIYAYEYPKSFNYYLEQGSFQAEVFGALYESLLTQHPLTMDFEPGLATNCSMSDDKKTFTFRLDPKARWSDGKPVTAQDVKWTFDTIMNPTNLTGVHKLLLGRFESPAILDELTIRFTAKEVHWQNLDTLAGFSILPRHAYEKQDFNKINFEFPVVSGPYRLGEVKESRYAVLERRKDWWNRDAKRVKGVGNFQALKFKFYAERENAFEAFKQGEIDLYPVYTAHIWATQTDGDKYAKHWIIKQQVYNYNPVGFQGFAMNMRRAPFDDLRVRQAMANLLDRKRMNSTLMHNAYFLHRSYFEDLYTAEQPCPNEEVQFDKEKARKLLKEAGWVVNPKTGLLEKDGKPFKFSFLSHETSVNKFLVIYQEAFKDVGIEMTINQKDAAAWSKDMDEFNFEMTWAAWSSGVRKDPEPMWYSAEADRRNGHNYSGVKNAKIDELVVRQRSIFDLQERHAICRQIDRLLAENMPYVPLWNINYVRLLYWNKFGMPPTVLGKYGDERAAYWYWWFDEDGAAELKDAMRANLALPARPAVVRFDEAFGGKKPPAGIIPGK